MSPLSSDINILHQFAKLNWSFICCMHPFEYTDCLSSNDQVDSDFPPDRVFQHSDSRLLLPVNTFKLKHHKMIEKNEVILSYRRSEELESIKSEVSPDDHLLIKFLKQTPSKQAPCVFTMVQ